LELLFLIVKVAVKAFAWGGARNFEGRVVNFHVAWLVLPVLDLNY
jgi:hypothetical protein